ncbi:MAG: YcaO-like family protein, partial [Actinomycetota bacterium]
WLDWPGLPRGSYEGSSNGAAAGNTLEEALLHGLLELVERDSAALWWHPMCERPAYDIAAWNDPRIAAALTPQRALGTEFWVLDITSDLGIPAAVAVAHGMSQTPAPIMGFGAHLDPVLAVVRALTELAQMQTVLVQERPDLLKGAGPAERRWFSTVTVENQSWLAPHGYADCPPAPSHTSLGEAIDDAVTRIEGAGMNVLWADASRPDVSLSVVRTYAPGLRHFWNRYAPGRLYEIPPRLGWCEGGYAEADLNPLAMIL